MKTPLFRGIGYLLKLENTAFIFQLLIAFQGYRLRWSSVLLQHCKRTGKSSYLPLLHQD